MATLNQLAQQVLDSLNRPFDAMFFERVKDLIVQQRALFIQQTIDKDGVDKEYRQTYYAEIEPVLNDEYTKAGTVKVWKTKNRIPKPIRWKNYTPFFYVGTENGRKPFKAGNYYSASLNQYLPMIGNVITYDYIDGYIYCFLKNDVVTVEEDKSALLSPIRIDEVMQNPRFVRVGAKTDTREDCTAFTDDMEFALPLDMANSLKTSIKELFITDHKDTLEKSHTDNV